MRRQRVRRMATMMLTCRSRQNPGRAKRPDPKVEETGWPDQCYRGLSNRACGLPPRLLNQWQLVASGVRSCAMVPRIEVITRRSDSRLQGPPPWLEVQAQAAGIGSHERRYALQFLPHPIRSPHPMCLTQGHPQSTPLPSDLEGRNLHGEAASQTMHGNPRVPEARMHQHRSNHRPRLEETPRLDHYSIAARFVGRGDSARPRRRGINSLHKLPTEHLVSTCFSTVSTGSTGTYPYIDQSVNPSDPKGPNVVSKDVEGSCLSHLRAGGTDCRFKYKTPSVGPSVGSTCLVGHWVRI
ncbi:hypothetical protein B0T21DRAFT_432349 [Apiosordaria backusii]|uniref:Uncharacterized protein n=1 Tax=Apiosordaria backusii TaxID=314023 RepID=A0AA40DFR5_9PEZI|nr:hypothetical protein B0T21DRAFT_432349 [Apiosordaria backusii]